MFGCLEGWKGAAVCAAVCAMQHAFCNNNAHNDNNAHIYNNNAHIYNTTMPTSTTPMHTSTTPMHTVQTTKNNTDKWNTLGRLAFISHQVYHRLVGLQSEWIRRPRLV